MKVFSFIRYGHQLKSIEVEVSLTPGLPAIQFMGLPDTAIKESIARIRSALYHQGFELPASRQILVNLRPNYLKKSSRGLDLAVAAAILWETQQLPQPAETPHMYGELSLKGEVLAPDDLQDLSFTELELLHTGLSKALNIATAQLRSLNDLAKPNYIASKNIENEIQRPELPNFLFNKEQAEVLSVIAHGEHPALFAGPSGLGKTTMAKTLNSLIRTPNARTFHSIRHMHTNLPWRPFVAPHHSATPRAMTGGGVPPLPGEISRAHGGILLLDELLEFAPSVIEALREPIESGEIRVSRSHKSAKFPADFLLLATTNLCPCGQYLPQKNCRCRTARINKYLEKLSGPLLDRFAIAFLLSSKRKGHIKTENILKRIQKAESFQKKCGQEKSNQKLTLKDFEENESPIIFEILPQTHRSHRRQLSLLRVARSFADLNQSEKIKPEHIQKSQALTIRNFQAIHQGAL